ncbi:MAG: GtrA family protein [Paracoccaceae bacterium]
MGRYLIVGGVNFVFTFAVFTTALELWNIGYVAALLLAWFAGNILTYALNFSWVFQPEAKLHFRGRFFKYLTAGAFSLGLNLLALSAMVELGSFDPFWSQVLIMPFIVALNFVSAKFWSLRKAKGGT